MNYRLASILGLAVLSSTALLADFQYEQTTRMTGGFLASMGRLGGMNKPITSTVVVKGNRMATLSPQNASIIDLDKETITSVDFDKKTYSVMTFQEMKQAMDDAMRSLEQRKGSDAKVEMQFSANVKETGQSKDVNGLPTKEYILTLAMTGTDQKSGQSGAMHLTNDMWVAADIRGYDEVRKFYERMAQKMGTVFQGLNPGAMMQPQMGKGMAEMAKEVAKIDGVPVLQVMRMGSTADGKPLPAASEAPELSKQSQVQMPSAGEVAGAAAGSAASSAAQSRMGRLGGIAGGVGGFGGFGRKKRGQQEEEQPKPDEQAAQPAQPGGALMMEITTETTNFSSAPVDASKLDVPSGFKQVESDMLRRNRR